MSAIVARRRAEMLVAELGLKEPQIDVEDVARKLGARVHKLNLDDVSGLLVSQPGTVPYIVVNEKHPPTRRRFTLAHEIGHLYLQHHFKTEDGVHVDRGNFISFRNERTKLGTDALEVEANQFAAALLMPTKMIQREAAKFGDLMMDTHVDDLARTFGVSQQAMTIRLSTLKLL